MQDWEHEAWHAVRHTIARYSWCGDFGDVDGFVACFTEDAVLQIKGGATYEGHAGMRRLGSGAGPNDSPAPSDGSRASGDAATTSASIPTPSPPIRCSPCRASRAGR